jgi:hypothetical protein
MVTSKLEYHKIIGKVAAACQKGQAPPQEGRDQEAAKQASEALWG